MKKNTWLTLTLIIVAIIAIIASVLIILPDNDLTPMEPTRIAPLYSQIDRSTVASLDGVTESATPTDYVLIDVNGYGKMLVRLYPDVAPDTVANFKRLVSEKFYDGIIFHRVIENFVIQCGDPDGDGISDPNEVTVKGEFSSNGFENNLKHKRGVLGLARSSAVNSGSSQFYICHSSADNVTALDGKYATFGFVVYGYDVLDAIATVDTNSSDKPKTDVVINSIRFVTVPATGSAN